ncbi:hypothetical protein C8Q76DRAFT_263848 [Earliella scabrosa]|nr:hypothetical protein C8Q76DRAFT_263848 [Earliella scabrosa]
MKASHCCLWLLWHLCGGGQGPSIVIGGPSGRIARHEEADVWYGAIGVCPLQLTRIGREGNSPTLFVLACGCRSSSRSPWVRAGARQECVGCHSSPVAIQRKNSARDEPGLMFASCSDMLTAYGVNVAAGCLSRHVDRFQPP